MPQRYISTRVKILGHQAGGSGFPTMTASLSPQALVSLRTRYSSKISMVSMTIDLGSTFADTRFQEMAEASI